MEGKELFGGAQAPSLGSLYKQAVGEIQDIGQEVRQDMPVTSTALEIGAGLGSGIGAAKTGAGQALGALARRGGLAGRIGAGALAGETAQRAYEAGTSELGQEGKILGKQGVSLGGILGGAIPAVGAVKRQVGKAISPRIEKSAEDLVLLAKKYNIPLGADDLTDNKFYQHLIQKGGSLPFSGAASNAENQLSSFTKAVARSVGLDDVKRLGAKEMDEAFDQVGKRFDDLTKGKTFSVNDDVLDSISSIQEGVGGGAYGEGGERLFNKHLNDLFARLKNDALDGDDLVALRNKFARISRKGTNPEAKTLAKDFENVLVDMIGEDAPEALRKAKYQYKNLIAIEPLAAKNQATGIISPAQLTNRVRQVYGRQFTRGKAGELGDLARIGQQIKQKVPDSGTAAGNIILGGLTGGSVPLAFISPVAAGAQLGTAGLGMLANRALQARNVNPNYMADLIKRSNLPAVASGSGIQAGAQTGRALGQLQNQQ